MTREEQDREGLFDVRNSEERHARPGDASEADAHARAEADGGGRGVHGVEQGAGAPGGSEPVKSSADGGGRSSGNGYRCTAGTPRSVGWAADAQMLTTTSVRS